MFADRARMFGLFPRRPSQPLDEDKIQVVEVDPLLTLESSLFHHPASPVTLIRNSDEGSWGALEEEVIALLKHRSVDKSTQPPTQ